MKICFISEIWLVALRTCAIVKVQIGSERPLPGIHSKFTRQSKAEERKSLGGQHTQISDCSKKIGLKRIRVEDLFPICSIVQSTSGKHEQEFIC